MRAAKVDVLYYVALFASFALGVATLWSVDYLPTNDGPQHIFVGHAENHYGDASSIYERQFVPQLQFAARGFNLWWNPLEPVLGFRDATRVVLSLFYGWMFGGYVLLVHALGKTRRWLGLLGCGISLCWPLYMGLFAYWSGVGIGLLLLGYVARRATFDRRAAIVVGIGLVVEFVHHAFSVVPTILFLCILVAVRTDRSERRPTFVRLALGLVPAMIGLLSLVALRPPSPPGLQEFHWEPIARRALILPRVLWSGGDGTRWLGNALLVVGLVASIARFRRVDRTERAFTLCAWTAAVLLFTLPIVIPGWQFLNVRFAAFLVVFTLPLIPIERLRREALEASLCALAAAFFVVSAVSFHRSLRASCADDLAGLSAPVKRSSFRLPVVLEPFCGLPRDATQSPVPFLGPARQLAALYATAQGGTVPNPFAKVFAIHPFTLRKGEGAPQVPIPEGDLFKLGEDLTRSSNPQVRNHTLQTFSVLGQSYDDILVFGVTDADVALLGELGYRPAFRQRSFAMMELDPCKAEVVIQDHPKAASITVAGGIAGRREITWELPVKPGVASPEGELAVPVGHRLCGRAWIEVRYRVGDSAFACDGTKDGKIHYVARAGEVTRVRCAAPAL
jgi:hypothetical protein